MTRDFADIILLKTHTSTAGSECSQNLWVAKPESSDVKNNAQNHPFFHVLEETLFLGAGSRTYVDCPL